MCSLIGALNSHHVVVSYCRFKSLNDINSNHFLLFHSGTRWLSFWLDFMAAMTTLLVSLFVVLSSNDLIAPSLKGLALTYTIQVNKESRVIPLSHVEMCVCVLLELLCVVQLTGMLQYVVRTSTEVEARFNSVERLQEYITVRYLSGNDPSFMVLPRPNPKFPPFASLKK